jgi:DNA polymerase-3 subunit gamma/tau
MTLLRLFAFQPQAPAAPKVSQNSLPKPSTNPSPKVPPKMSAAPTAAATDRQEASPSHSAEPQPAIAPQAWPSISRTISVSGLARQFIQQAQLLSCTDAGAVMRCRFRVAIPALTEAAIVSKAQEAMTQYFGKPCKIETEVGEVTDMTAAVEDADAAAKAQSKAEQAIHNDPLVQSLLQDLGGQIVPGSIRPANPHSKGNAT